MKRRKSSATEDGFQLRLALGSAAPRWILTRPLALSPHRRRILERLETVRAFYPELEGVVIRVGLVSSRRVLGRGSLDPETPGVWLRPRAGLFTMAHELAHLLQARKRIPSGERACDLYALARSPLLVDSLPSYLRLPAEVPREEPPADWLRLVLYRAAREATADPASGRREALRRFSARLGEALRQPKPPLTAGTIEISAPSTTGVASPPV